MQCQVLLHLSVVEMKMLFKFFPATSNSYLDDIIQEIKLFYFDAHEIQILINMNDWNMMLKIVYDVLDRLVNFRISPTFKRNSLILDPEKVYNFLIKLF